MRIVFVFFWRGSTSETPVQILGDPLGNKACENTENCAKREKRRGKIIKFGREGYEDGQNFELLPTVNNATRCQTTIFANKYRTANLIVVSNTKLN